MDENLLTVGLISAIEMVPAMMEARGSLSKAADILGVTEARMFQVVEDAEKAHGRIFKPGTERSELTRMGEILYDLGRSFQRFEDQKAMPDSHTADEEVLRVGYSRSHLGLVAGALSGLIKPGRRLKIQVTEASPRKVRRLLRDEEIDIGITYLPRSRETARKWMEEKRLGNLPLVLVVLKGSKVTKKLHLGNRREISAEELVDVPLALLELDDTDVRAEVNRYFRHSQPRNIVVETDAATTLLAFAREGIPTILPAFPQDEEVFDVVPLIPVTGQKHATIRTSVLWNKNVVLKPSADEAIKALEIAAVEAWEQYAPPELVAAVKSAPSP